MAMQLQHKLFTVDDLEQMLESGILTENDNVELLDGELVTMSPVGSRHVACVNRLNQSISRIVGEEAIVSVQNPIRIRPDSQPEPDIAILRPRDDFYANALPEAIDVLLLIEVSDSSLDYDKEIKLGIYGRGGVPEVWIVNLHDEQVDSYRGPFNGGYRLRERFLLGENIKAELLPALEVNISQIFGK
ncbi:MAG: Uma2 family endonuclease [Caldilineaceae bacterium]